MWIYFHRSSDIKHQKIVSRKRFTSITVIYLHRNNVQKRQKKKEKCSIQHGCNALVLVQFRFMYERASNAKIELFDEQLSWFSNWKWKIKNYWSRRQSSRDWKIKNRIKINFIFRTDEYFNATRAVSCRW